MQRRGWILPVILLAGTIVLLIGCIPIPATHQLQPDLTPRPEFYIGSTSKSPIWLGHTSIEDAFILLTNKTSSQLIDGWPAGEVEHRISIFDQWRISDDRSRLAVTYQVRAQTVIYPLCFFAHADFDQRWLVLNVDEHHVVVGSETTRNFPLGLGGPIDFTQVFDDAARSRMRAASVLPSDDNLKAHFDIQMNDRLLQQRRLQRPSTRSTGDTHG